MGLSRRLTVVAVLLGNSWSFSILLIISSTDAVEEPAGDDCSLMQVQHHRTKAGARELFQACSKVVPVTGSQRPMPALGFGTCCRDGASGQPLIDSTKIWLSSGGRLVDTAEAYENQPDIAVAIRDSGVPREEIWITSKVNTHDKRSRSDVVASIDRSLQELGVDYIDLMLLHDPLGAGPPAELFRGLLEAKKSGRIRNAGVSNYNQTLVEELVSATGEAPAVNQIEFHPWSAQWTKNFVKWMQGRGIAVTAYSVLGGKKVQAQDDAVAALADKYKVTNAQVLVQWALDKGVAPLVGASSQEHIWEDLNCSGLQHLSEVDALYLEISERPENFQERFFGKYIEHK
mmetsp:Transcript_40963/g.72031  ORF Transcript_40963/g.72031 Transcript_40963/m.72031 type:complete len:345 (-) Transcript_40963:28-1062(-)